MKFTEFHIICIRITSTVQYRTGTGTGLDRNRTGPELDRTGLETQPDRTRTGPDKTGPDRTRNGPDRIDDKI